MEKLMNGFWWRSSSTSSKSIRWLAWERMSMSKKRGGLGFRNLHGFNLALLGKQCWNFVNKPDALVSRVLKARYYPNWHFLQASRTGGSSYTWSGIWEAKEEIKKGLRWVLGDGQTINIRSDRWLKGKEDLHVNQEGGSSTGLESKVCHYFQEGRKIWDEDKIRSHFNEEDADAILRTRIPQICTKDRIAWVHSINGQYTVKTGYQIWHQNHIGDMGLQHSNGWSNIWSLEVPRRFKIFLWRFCRNNVPVRILLRGRGVTVPVGCTMCVGDIEHLLHLFFDCNFAKDCWHQVGLAYDMQSVENASEWLIEKLSKESNDNLVKISTVLWGVWFARNKRIFEGKNITPAVAMSWSAKQISEWQLANKRKIQIRAGMGSHTQRDDQKWQPPNLGSLKINVDASVVAGQRSFAVGMVIRNHQGQYLSGKTLRFAGCVSVVEAEMVGILQALLWTDEFTADGFSIESDSLIGVNALKHDQVNLLELGDIIQHCKLVVQSKGGILVEYVRKRANDVAHKMARTPCELNSFIVHSSPPSNLLETILSESLMF